MEGATVSVALVFSIVAVISQMYGIYTGHKKNQEEEERKEIEIEKSFMRLSMKLDHFQETTTAMLQRQEEHAVRMEKMSGEIIKSNERIATLLKYKDDHELRLKRLEEK